MTNEYLRDRINILVKSVRRKKDKIEVLTNKVKELEDKINKEKQ